MSLCQVEAVGVSVTAVFREDTHASGSLLILGFGHGALHSEVAVSSSVESGSLGVTFSQVEALSLGVALVTDSR